MAFGEFLGLDKIMNTIDKMAVVTEKLTPIMSQLLENIKEQNKILRDIAKKLKE